MSSIAVGANTLSGFVYNVAQRLARTTSGLAQTDLADHYYDALGNATQEIRVDSAVTYVTAYTYDLASHVTQMTYPSGLIVAYGRDAMGRIASVTMQASASASPVTLASGALYEPFGPLAALSYGNGLNLSAQFDEDYQPSVRSVAGISTVQNLSYAFDAAGDLTAITDSLDTTRNQTLHYDALYRLTQAGGVYGTFAYGYDATGNRTSLALSGSGGDFSSAYNYATTSNQVQTVVTGAATRTLSYGATGNITGDDFGNGTVYGFTYDQSNRLVQSTSVAPGQYLRTNAYEQDFLGQRVSKNFGNVFDFTYDRAGHPLAERVGTSAYFSQYVWLDDLPLAFISFGSIDYIHTDHLGTPQKMTDDGENVVWDGGASDPFLFGQLPWSPQYMNLRFPGQYFDSETGLHHNGMRDYDPTIGRYIESDPIGLAGGINTYAYVGSNPVRYADPQGTFAFVLVLPVLPEIGAIVAEATPAVVGVLTAAGIMSMSGDTSSDKAKSDASVSRADQSKDCPDDDCKNLVAQIDKAVSELQGRYDDIISNSLGLPPTGRMSVAGHQQQFQDKQANLRKLLNEANTKGCTGYNSDAWAWATRPTPSPH